MHFLLLVVVFSTISIVYFSVYTGISPMPTSSKAKNQILLLSKDIKGKAYELGAGFGGMLLALGHKNAFSEIVGYELSPIPWLIAFLRITIAKRGKLKVFRKDFFDVSLKDAHCIYCYLYPKSMEKLKKKFENELSDGTIVISNTFAIPGWEIEKKLTVNDLFSSPIYYYIYYSRRPREGCSQTPSQNTGY